MRYFEELQGSRRSAPHGTGPQIPNVCFFPALLRKRKPMFSLSRETLQPTLRITRGACVGCRSEGPTEASPLRVDWMRPACAAEKRNVDMYRHSTAAAEV
jgi:hypothetical protein